MATETRIKRVTKEQLGAVIDALGENVKQVIAAKELSDNCSYTITYEYTLPTMTVAQPGSDDNLLGKTVQSLQKNVTIGSDTITATLKYLSSYPGFGSGYSGNFFATKTTTSADKVYLTIVTTNGSKEYLVYDSDNTDPYDGIHIQHIPNKNLEKIVVRFIDGNEETVKEYKCNFTYETEEENQDDGDDIDDLLGG